MNNQANGNRPQLHFRQRTLDLGFIIMAIIFIMMIPISGFIKMWKLKAERDLVKLYVGTEANLTVSGF